jgi:putative peptidoglycan lipid II flippase
LRLVAANLAMVGLLLAALAVWPSWSDWSWWQRAWRMGVLVAGGGGTYLLVLLASGLRPRHFRAQA